ncbi:MAG: choice-of-anchor Q domain-containing protein [Bacteroidota bacterium]
MAPHGTQHDFVFNRCEAYTLGDGFVFGGGVTNATANRCSAHDAEVGFKMYGDNIVLTNCLGYHNETSNLELDWDGEAGTTVARNCTFMDSQVYNVWVEHGSDSLHMYNCIVAGSDNIGLAFEQRNATNYRGDYNIFHDDDGEMVISVGYEDEFTVAQVEAGNWTAYSGQDQHSFVCSDANSQLFEDLANRDLHLKAGSMAIDAGTSENAPSVDRDGVSRPQGAGFDIGAYERKWSENEGAAPVGPGGY